MQIYEIDRKNRVCEMIKLFFEEVLLFLWILVVIPKVNILNYFPK